MHLNSNKFQFYRHVCFIIYNTRTFIQIRIHKNQIYCFRANVDVMIKVFKAEKMRMKANIEREKISNAKKKKNS